MEYGVGRADGFEGARDLFASCSGFIAEGLHAFNAKRVIFMDRMNVFHVLRRRMSPDEVIAAKFRCGTKERRPLIQVSENERGTIKTTIENGGPGGPAELQENQQLNPVWDEDPIL